MTILRLTLAAFLTCPGGAEAFAEGVQYGLGYTARDQEIFFSADNSFGAYRLFTRPNAATVSSAPAASESGESPSPQQLSLSNVAVFQKWVASLCQSPPVEEAVNERRKSNGFSTTIVTAKNALGSLLIFLENFESDLNYVSSCKRERALVKQACFSLAAGPLPGRTLVSATEPGHDLLEIHSSAMRFGRIALGKYFGELAEIGGLSESASSSELARKIRHAAEGTATCRMRGLSTRHERHSIAQF